MVLTTESICAGALIRKQVRSILEQAQRNGLNATWVEDKGLIESTFYNVRVQGNEEDVRRVARQIQLFMQLYA